MRSCYQFKDLNVLQHGLSVRNWYSEIIDLLYRGKDSECDLEIPAWCLRPLVNEAISRVDDSLMEMYQVYHDCGKPFSLVVHEDGSRHYPDHAAVSKRVWLECSDVSDGASWIADMIGWDMDFHLLRSSGVNGFAARGDRAIALMLTALAEIHANSEMFGGMDSTGFKIKYKHSCRMGRHVIDAIEGAGNV